MWERLLSSKGHYLVSILTDYTRTQINDSGCYAEVIKALLQGPDASSQAVC